MTNNRRKQDSSTVRPDRRVVRTRQGLRDALMALIVEQGYESLSVQDITDRANIGRATFYLHFKDKEDLLMRSLEETYDDLISRMPLATSITSMTNGQSAPGLVAFEHAAANFRLYQVIMNDPGGMIIQRRIHDYVAKVAAERIRDSFTDIPIPVDIVSQHVAGSLIALLSWWIHNNMPYPADYMAQMYGELTLNALRVYTETLRPGSMPVS